MCPKDGLRSRFLDYALSFPSLVYVKCKRLHQSLTKTFHFQKHVNHFVSSSLLVSWLRDNFGSPPSKNFSYSYLAEAMGDEKLEEIIINSFETPHHHTNKVLFPERGLRWSFYYPQHLNKSTLPPSAPSHNSRKFSKPFPFFCIFFPQ
jgi:hypothetical protein